MKLKRILWTVGGITILGGLMFLISQPDDSPWRAFGPWGYWLLAGLFVIAAAIRLLRGPGPHKTHYVRDPMAADGQSYGSLMTGSADQGASTAFTDNSLAALTPLTELTEDHQPPEEFKLR
ncbi:hypothetical protein [Glutamicibacter sp.]|uniref:hypothetical protein n=1 Tax=Glutamicibacter sp. TaxID=1931995 RepID=UPI0028BEC694|nr:hypothetical protein [Glutamicibacter sp.]